MRLQLLEAGSAGRKNSSRNCHCTFGVPAAASSMASLPSPTVEPPGAWMWDGREHGAWSTEHGAWGIRDDPLRWRSIPAGCWLLAAVFPGGVAPRVDLVSSSHLRSPRSCETCWVLGARLLDAPLHSRAFKGVNIYCFSPVSSLFPSSILSPPFARHVTNPGDAVMSFHSIPQHPSSFRALVRWSAAPTRKCRAGRL